MLASLVLATFVCSVEPNNVENCQSSYVSTWVSTQDYGKDKADCLSELKANYPDDVIDDPKDPNKFSFAACYRVLPGETVGIGKDKVYLQNIQDADDNLTDFSIKLK